MTRPTMAYWRGSRVRVVFPGHPDDGRVGAVVGVRRATRYYEQRARVLFDDGDASYVSTDRLQRVDE